MPAEEVEQAALLGALEELDGSLDVLRELLDGEDADIVLALGRVSRRTAPTSCGWMGCWPNGGTRLTCSTRSGCTATSSSTQIS